MPLYDAIGHNYSSRRRADPRIASAIDHALGDVRSIANIGAGAGSYEPRGRTVVALEPSDVMIRQRPADAAPCRQGVAEALPVESKSVDAAMAILTTHHWTDLEKGLLELARVARRRVVILTWVPDAAPFWLTDEYFPEILAHDRTIFPSANRFLTLVDRVIGPTRSTVLALPHDCVDGMLCAYWRRPEAYLDADVRAAISSFARINAERGLKMLRDDLATGRWRERHGDLALLDELDLGYRIFVSEVRPERR